MAYAKHYTINARGKQDYLFTYEIWERDYSGGIEEIDAAASPFVLSLLSQSDNQFEPIAASQMQLKIDITDFVGTFIEFNTVDDRQYWIRFYGKYVPAPGKARIYWQNHETATDDNNLSILVNGVQVLIQFTNGTGFLDVNEGDIIQCDQVWFVGSPDPTAEWQLQIQSNGIDIYNNTTPTHGTPITQSFTFTSNSQYVYYVMCQSYNNSNPPITIPDLSYYLWQGFLLIDGVNMPFTTGRIVLTMDATDGIAILKDIPYVPTNPDYSLNDVESVLQIVLNCLNQIVLPNNGLYLNVCVSIYALGMLTRTDGEQNTPLEQSFLPIRNWLSGPALDSLLQYEWGFKNCYDVLSDILTSFGCQLLQSGAEFYFVSVAERAGTTIYYTRFDQTGVVQDYGKKDISTSIIPYTPTAEHFFIENRQAKINRKGYKEIDLNHSFGFPPQCLDNGLLTKQTTGFPDNWTPVTTGISQVLLSSVASFYIAFLLISDSAANTQADVVSSNIARGIQGDVMELSFLMNSIGSNTLAALGVRVSLAVGAGTLYLSSTGEWTTVSADGYYFFSVPAGSTTYSQQSLTTSALPSDGNITIDFFVSQASTVHPNTVDTCIIGNFVLTFSNSAGKRLVASNYGQGSYKKSQDIPLGATNSGMSKNMIGSFLLSDGSIAIFWSRQDFPFEQYNNLMRLIIQQYVDVQELQQINMDGSTWGLVISDGILGLMVKFLIQDGTNYLNVDGKPYIPGNLSIDYFENTVSGTLLTTSNTDISPTFIDVVIPN